MLSVRKKKVTKKNKVTVMDYKIFKDLQFKGHPTMGPGGSRAYMEFPNGYGISVVTGEYAYSDDEHPYEAAVLHEGRVCYDTPITDDVVGHLDEEGVTEIMKKIQEL